MSGSDLYELLTGENEYEEEGLHGDFSDIFETNDDIEEDESLSSEEEDAQMTSPPKSKPLRLAPALECSENECSICFGDLTGAVAGILPLLLLQLRDIR